MNRERILKVVFPDPLDDPTLSMAIYCPMLITYVMKNAPARARAFMQVEVKYNGQYMAMDKAGNPTSDSSSEAAETSRINPEEAKKH